jgi:hypothetical protein
MLDLPNLASKGVVYFDDNTFKHVRARMILTLGIGWTGWNQMVESGYCWLPKCRMSMPHRGTKNTETESLRENSNRLVVSPEQMT